VVNKSNIQSKTPSRVALLLVATDVRSGWFGTCIGLIYRHTTKNGTPAGQDICCGRKMISHLEEIMADMRAW
jgi:hypothetical protein